MYHSEAVIEHFQNDKAVQISKNAVHDNVRHMLYFSLMSSLSFNEYPRLLATTNRCKVEVGNINHTHTYTPTHTQIYVKIL